MTAFAIANSTPPEIFANLVGKPVEEVVANRQNIWSNGL
jgi:hypothetical protein